MLKFALVGCGRIANRHASLLAENQIKGAELVAVCDIDKNKARNLANKYKIPYFTDMLEMAKELDIDAISILTESGNHAKDVIELAKYSKNILVEKPMSLLLADAEKMINECKKYNTKLFIIKQNRFNVPVVHLKKALDEGRFGNLILGTVRVRWCRDQSYYDQDSWRGTWKYDGGVLTNQASHHIDLLEWMMGDVESVYAKSTTALVNIEAEDTAVVILKFKNGAMGVIEATTAIRPKDLEGSISVLGEHGSVEIGGFAVNEMKTWNFSHKIDGDDNVIDKFSVNPPNVYGFGHQAYYEHVVDSINNNKPPMIDGHEGLKSLKLINAIYESIETGNEVFLDYTSQYSKLGR
jgi:predicted dehydrogenase